MEGRNGTPLGEKKSSRTNAAGEKERAILKACKERNLSDLRALAESLGGFLTDSIRAQACE